MTKSFLRSEVQVVHLLVNLPFTSQRRERVPHLLCPFSNPPTTSAPPLTNSSSGPKGANAPLLSPREKKMSNTPADCKWTAFRNKNLSFNVCVFQPLWRKMSSKLTAFILMYNTLKKHKSIRFVRKAQHRSLFLSMRGIV